jgi:putative flippase GtrA
MSEKSTKKAGVMQAVKFALFSASAGIIQVVSFTLLNEFFPDMEGNNAITNWLFNSEYGAKYLVALILSVLWNFTFNRKFTFKSANNIPIAMLKVFGFYCVFTPVSVILGELVAQRTTWEFAEYIILAVTMLTNMITEFLFCRFFVYKDSMNTATKEKDKTNV